MVPLHGDPVGDVLDRVDRLAVAADQQAEVVALEVGTDLLVVLLDVDARFDPDAGEDLLEQFLHA